MTVRGPLPIGSQLWLDEQAYTVVEHRPYRRADDTETHLNVWRTACPDCGATFDEAGAGLSRLPNRRCTSCRKPNGRRPVVGRGKRVSVTLQIGAAA